MSLASLTTPFPWLRYSKKAQQKLLTMRQAGFFTFQESQERGVFLAVGKSGEVDLGNSLFFYLLIDKQDGTCIDCKYLLFGQTALIAAAEATAELAIGKKSGQLLKLSADLIDRQLRDKQDKPSFPKEAYPHINLCLEALFDAAASCKEIALPESAFLQTPEELLEEGGVPEFGALSLKDKIGVLERVLDQDIRPYIALDDGGVEILNIKEPFEVFIAYKGSCTSCFSAIGTTLSYIQQTLREKVHPSIVVTPDIDFDNLR